MHLLVELHTSNKNTSDLIAQLFHCFAYGLHRNWGIHRTVGRAFLFPADARRSPVLRQSCRIRFSPCDALNSWLSKILLQRWIFENWSETNSSALAGWLWFRIPTCPDRLWDPSSLQFNGYRGSFVEIKWGRHEFSHSPTSRGEVKNERSCASTLL